MNVQPDFSNILLETDVLRTAVVIAETGSFTKAAQRVFRTPSAVSMQIKKLEDTLGRQVFTREARQVRVTPEGEALIGYARRILRLNDEAVGLFRKPETQEIVRFGAPDDFGTRYLPDILCRFAGTHPWVQVDVKLDLSINLNKQLEAGELDICMLTANANEMESEVIHIERLVWTGLRGGCAAERNPVPLALCDRGCSWRDVSVKLLEESGRPYRMAYSSPHLASQRAAVICDLAISVFPESHVEPPLVRLDERHGLPILPRYAIALRRASNASNAVDAFSRHVEACVAEMSGKPPQN